MDMNFAKWITRDGLLNFLEKEVDFARVCITLQDVNSDCAIVLIDEELQIKITRDLQIYLVSIYRGTTNETVDLYNIVSPKYNLETFGISPPYFVAKAGYLKGRLFCLDSNTHSLKVMPCENISEDMFSEPVYPVKLNVEENGNHYVVRYLDANGNIKIYFKESKLKEITGFEIRSETGTILDINFKEGE